MLVSRLIQLNAMGHGGVPRLLKTCFEDRFVVCCLALGDGIGDEWMDMISTTQHLNVMSLPNCGFDWPLAEGFNWILRVNQIDHGSPFSKGGHFLSSDTQLFMEMTCGFGSPGHFSALLLIKPCQRNKSMCSSLNSKRHLKFSCNEASECN